LKVAAAGDFFTLSFYFIFLTLFSFSEYPRSETTKGTSQTQATRVRKIKVLSNGLNSTEFVPEPKESQFKLFKMFAKVHPAEKSQDDDVFSFRNPNNREEQAHQKAAVAADSTTSTEDGESDRASPKQPKKLTLQHASTAPLMSKIKPQTSGPRTQVMPFNTSQLNLSLSDPNYVGGNSKSLSPHNTPRSAEFILHRDKQLQREATLYHKMIVKPMRMLGAVGVIRTSQEQPIL
jgi:hypothetical protein